VVQQTPASGTSLRRSSHVSLVVSSGANPQPATAVPNVVGESQATAANDLKSAGFKVVVLNRPVTKSTQDGKVVDEQPHGGSNIPGGSQVTIFVGRFSGG
jgi:serine/threonine-protein kinase